MATKKTRGGRRDGAGRKPSANPLGPGIMVRLDATTDAAFRARCKKAGMSLSDRLRLLVEQDLLHDLLT